MSSCLLAKDSRGDSAASNNEENQDMSPPHFRINRLSGSEGAERKGDITPSPRLPSAMTILPKRPISKREQDMISHIGRTKEGGMAFYPSPMQLFDRLCSVTLVGRVERRSNQRLPATVCIRVLTSWRCLLPDRVMHSTRTSIGFSWTSRREPSRRFAF